MPNAGCLWFRFRVLFLVGFRVFFGFFGRFEVGFWPRVFIAEAYPVIASWLSVFSLFTNIISVLYAFIRLFFPPPEPHPFRSLPLFLLFLTSAKTLSFQRATQRTCGSKHFINLYFFMLAKLAETLQSVHDLCAARNVSLLRCFSLYEKSG